MHLVSTALTSSNVRLCRPFWCASGAYTADEVSRAVSRTSILLDTEGARGVLISDQTGRPLCYGVTVFVEEQFADDYVQAPYPLVGKQLLLGERTAILTSEFAIGLRNARSGLQMLVVAQDWDVTGLHPEAYHWMVAKLVTGFFEIHRGFRLERIINEVIGSLMVEDVSSSEAFAFYRRMEHVRRDGQPIPVLLATITRQEAISRRSLLMPMFFYDPPRVRFTAAERDLIRAALEGATDVELAERLGIALSAVKARWNRVVDRIEDRLPALLAEHRAASVGVRGSQVRHLIREFVRANPSELTPYSDIASLIQPGRLAPPNTRRPQRNAP